MRPLYEIGTDLVRLNELLDEIEGDLSRAPEGEAALAAVIDGLAAEQGEKLDHYLGLIRQLVMEAAAAKAEAEQWAAKAQARERRAERLTEALKLHLEATGQAKVVTARGRTVSVVSNGGSVPLSIDSRQTDAIPDEYWVVERKLNRGLIRERLEAGAELPWAALGQRGTHLRVR